MFWINLPICALAILLTAIFVPESKSATMRDVDPIGQGLGMAFLFGIVYVLIEGPVLGWADARTIVVAVVAVSPSSPSCATSRGATTRSSICGSSGASRSPRRR